MKIAALCSAYFPLSHADVIVSRWLETRLNDARWGWQPRSEIASLYVEQFPANDMARDLSARLGVPIYDSIKSALCLGGEKLAVDGVLLICEHGDYPLNDLKQKLYPRAQWFDQIAATFEWSGDVAAVWVDKGLSWNPDWARAMVETARAQNIPLMAGSSLPHCGYDSAFPFAGAGVQAAVALFCGGPEIYGYHSLELTQSALETRAGGERGIVAVTALAGEQVWRAIDEGIIAPDLFAAALGVAANVEAGDVRANCRSRSDLDAVLASAHIRGGMTATTAELWPVAPLAFLVEHADGLRVAHVLLEGHIGDYCLAARHENEVWAARMRTTGAAEFHPHFALQNAAIEDFFGGAAPASPLARGLLCTLATEKWMRALQTPGVRIETPELHA